MPNRHPASEYVKLFQNEDIPRIIQNIQECCKGLIRESPYEQEKYISKRLFFKLIKKPEYLDGPIVPQWESWLVPIEEDDENFSGRADILFSGSGIYTYFLIEAKRLYVPFPSGTDHLLGEYINEGMMRFVKGQYAPMMIASAMLGYVFDNSVANTKKALAGAVHLKAAELQLSDDGDFQQSAIVANPPVDETRHSLDQRKFTIYHILAKV